MTAGSTDWFVSDRSEHEPVVAGVCMAAGYLHQQPTKLGVAALTAAWLHRELSRPVEVVDGGGRFGEAAAHINHRVSQGQTTFTFAGSESAVVASLDRLDALLRTNGEVVVDDELRARARMFANPLEPWWGHVKARWRGNPLVLTTLGPVALASLDGSDVRAYASHLNRVERVYWTNEPRVATLATPAWQSDVLAPWALPEGRGEPGCVMRRSAGEQFSTVADQYDPAAHVALRLVGSHLHRRLVEFEPLASAVDLRLYGLTGGVGLVVCALADVQGSLDEVSGTVLQTIDDLLAGAEASDELLRVRDAMSAEASAARWHDASALADVAQRHVALGDRPTPRMLGAAVGDVTRDQVVAALAGLRQRLLLAVSPQLADGGPPLPMAEPVRMTAVKGTVYSSFAEPGLRAACSDTRVGLMRRSTRWEWVRGGHRPAVMVGAVDFADVVLRVDAEDVTTTLIDDELRSVQIAFPTFRNGKRLRQRVRQATAAAPLIRIPVNPDYQQWLGGVVRRQRTRLGTAAMVLVAVVLVSVLGAMSSRQRPVEGQFTVGETVHLPNGSTLEVTQPPERIVNYNGVSLLAVPLRMCGGGANRGRGRPEARNVLAPWKFALIDNTGEVVASPGAVAQVPQRPQVPDVNLVDGECAHGWLNFPPLQDPSSTPRLRYSNLPGDLVIWRLPAPLDSELSRPCPSESDAAQPPGC